MQVVVATVTKLTTDDGLVTFLPHVTVGTRYLVDLDSLVRGQSMVARHADGTMQSHVKDIIWTVGEGWLPVECLAMSAS